MGYPLFLLSWAAVTFAVFSFVPCINARHQTSYKHMEPDSVPLEESLQLHVQETHIVVLRTAGAAGYQLSFRISDSSVLSVMEVAPPADSAKAGQTNVGGSVPAHFEIKALKKGRARVEFFEGRLWSKETHERICKVLAVDVPD